MYISKELIMAEPIESSQKPQKLKLNYRRTRIIGFAFFGILLLWQVYDSWCSPLLSDAFKKALKTDKSEEVQYLVGLRRAIDNLAALIRLPIFGHLSDKTHTKIGKRRPYILVGTFVSAVAFPFIPLFYHYNNIGGMIAMMAIVVFFMRMYRNPAVALRPDRTPKPLRSKANGIINIMGYIGGAFATIVGRVFVLSDYLGANNKETWATGNIWAVELPFLIASVLRIISALVLFFCIDENKIEKEREGERKRGEEEAAVENKVTDNGPRPKANKIRLILILAAEFFWFRADNGIGTFMSNYTLYYLHSSTKSLSINTILGGLGSVIGFALGGLVAEKIGRKWTIVSGLSLTALSLLIWVILTFSLPIKVPTDGYNSFPIYIYAVWFAKGLGRSLVHVNSFPMVVELCTSKKIGRFTGYYYASSRAAQTITPCLLGLLLLHPSFGWQYLPVYALVCILVSFAVFFFVKNIKSKKTSFKKGLAALDQDD